MGRKVVILIVEDGKLTVRLMPNFDELSEWIWRAWGNATEPKFNKRWWRFVTDLANWLQAGCPTGKIDNLD